MQRDMSVIDAGDLLRAGCVHSAGWRHWRQLRGGTCLTMLTLSCVDVVCSWSRCFFFSRCFPWLEASSLHQTETNDARPPGHVCRTQMEKLRCSWELQQRRGEVKSKNNLMTRYL
jgi:hypothetical protein